MHISGIVSSATEIPLQQLIDTSVTNITIVGSAVSGTAESDPKWKIYKVDETTPITQKLYPYDIKRGAPSGDFVFVWEDRDSYQYSASVDSHPDYFVLVGASNINRTLSFDSTEFIVNGIDVPVNASIAVVDNNSTPIHGVVSITVNGTPSGSLASVSAADLIGIHIPANSITAPSIRVIMTVGDRKSVASYNFAQIMPVKFDTILEELREEDTNGAQ